MKKLFAVVILMLLGMFMLSGCSIREIKSDVKDIIIPTEPTTARPTATVTFPEGFNVVQIAEKLEENSVCTAEAFISLLNNETFISSLGYDFTVGLFDEERPFYLEGYIFPDTYEFYLNDKPENVIIKILNNTNSKLTQDYALRAQEMGYTLDEIIAIASVIQEEAFTVESMKLISSVLYNRINTSMKLQCDVTIVYLEKYVLNSPYLNITDGGEDFKQAYNTYKCDAIPRGAICCPGIEAIEAALYPEKSDYFYFVTDTQLNYYFSETWEEHDKKCKELGL